MISLRPVRVEDTDALFPLIYQTGVADTLLWDGPESLESYRQVLAARALEVARGEKHMFTIVETESGNPMSGNPIGTTSIRPDLQAFCADVGLWIGKPFQGKGYGTQVIARLVEYGFNRLGLKKVAASVFVGNWASRRIFENNGFLLEGTLRQAVQKYGKPQDEWLFGLTYPDFIAWQMAGQRHSDYLLHLVTRQDWQAAVIQQEYRAASLSREGFIHCSRPEQINGVANRFYQGQKGLVLLWIDPSRLKTELRWEAADEQVFPHLYGPLNLDAVAFVTEFEPNEEGLFQL